MDFLFVRQSRHGKAMVGVKEIFNEMLTAGQR